MKKIRVIAALVLVLCIFGISAVAAPFAPSVGSKPAPTPVEDIVIVTPSTNTELKDNNLSNVANFAGEWKDATGGAPIDNAIVSDVFEVT